MESLSFAKVALGYKVYLQDGWKISGGLICSHCKLILNDAVQTVRSGLRFCRLCFDSKPDGVDATEEIWSDVAARKEIAKLSLLCQNRINGCEWTGVFEDYIGHIKSFPQAHAPKDHVQATDFAVSKSDTTNERPKEELKINSEVLLACSPNEDVAPATNYINQSQPHPPLVR